LCERCGQKIRDRWLLKVGDTHWHEECLTCCVCHAPLAHSCYFRNAKLYCKLDYDRIFGVKCSRCGERLLPQELVMRASVSPPSPIPIPMVNPNTCPPPLETAVQFTRRSSLIGGIQIEQKHPRICGVLRWRKNLERMKCEVYFEFMEMDEGFPSVRLVFHGLIINPSDPGSLPNRFPWHTLNYPTPIFGSKL